MREYGIIYYKADICLTDIRTVKGGQTMKTLKRIGAVVLLIAIVMAMCGTAFASSKIPSKVYTTGKVFMRTNASLNAKSITTVKSGVWVPCSDVKKDSRKVVWYKVTYNGKTGWISSVYATPNKKDPPRSKVVAADGDSWIRSKPNKDSKKLSMLPSGKKATYCQQSQKDGRGVRWYKVTYQGVTGWVSSKFTKLR